MIQHKMNMKTVKLFKMVTDPQRDFRFSPTEELLEVVKINNYIHASQKIRSSRYFRLIGKIFYLKESNYNFKHYFRQMKFLIKMDIGFFQISFLLTNLCCRVQLLSKILRPYLSAIIINLLFMYSPDPYLTAVKDLFLILSHAI